MVGDNASDGFKISFIRMIIFLISFPKILQVSSLQNMITWQVLHVRSGVSNSFGALGRMRNTKMEPACACITYHELAPHAMYSLPWLQSYVPHTACASPAHTIQHTRCGTHAACSTRIKPVLYTRYSMQGQSLSPMETQWPQIQCAELIQHRHQSSPMHYLRHMHQVQPCMPYAVFGVGAACCTQGQSKTHRQYHGQVDRALMYLSCTLCLARSSEATMYFRKLQLHFQALGEVTKCPWNHSKIHINLTSQNRISS